MDVSLNLLNHMAKCILLILVSLLFLQINTQAQSTNSKDSLVVSFISIGAGTDYKAKEKLDLFIKDFQNEYHVQLDVTIKHWGREGETDYIYNLNKLSKKQCKTFVAEMEAMFSKNNLVKISRNHPD